MTTAEKYVTAAFLVVLAVVLLWLVIYAFKMRRLHEEVRELAAREPAPAADPSAGPRVVPARDAATDAEHDSRHAPEPVR